MGLIEAVKGKTTVHSQCRGCRFEKWVRSQDEIVVGGESMSPEAFMDELNLLLAKAEDREPSITWRGIATVAVELLPELQGEGGTKGLGVTFADHYRRGHHVGP